MLGAADLVDVRQLERGEIRQSKARIGAADIGHQNKGIGLARLAHKAAFPTKNAKMTGW